MRYIDPTLAAYVGEEVLLRYDPRDVAEVRVFHEGRFLCRAVCQELAGETVALREIVSARNVAAANSARRSRTAGGWSIPCCEAKRWDAGEKGPEAASPEPAPRR